MTINGTLTVGTYLAYIGLLGWIIWPMRNLGRLVVQMSMGVVSFGRVQTIIREDREPLDEGTYRPTARSAVISSSRTSTSSMTTRSRTPMCPSCEDISLRLRPRARWWP